MYTLNMSNIWGIMSNMGQCVIRATAISLYLLFKSKKNIYNIYSVSYLY